MNYYIGSTTMIDNLYFEDGNTIQGVAGGAGVYALLGGKLWTDNIYLVSGVGRNYIFKFKKWFEKNNLSMSFLKTMKTDTPINRIYYYRDGSKKERRKLTKEHDVDFEYSPEDFKKHLQEKCGLYIFRNADPIFWNHLNNHKKATVLWKITHDACKKPNLAKIQSIVKNVDVFSINLSYAEDLFEISDRKEVFKELYKLKVPLIHVVSEEGQYFLKFNRDIFVPLQFEEQPVDITGGDHASAGAVLVGVTKSESLYNIGLMANHSYNMVTSQYGLPDYIQEYKNLIELKGR